MKDTHSQTDTIDDTHRHSQTYLDGVRRMQETEKQREQKAYAWMVIAAAAAGGYSETTKTNRVVVLARNFCILFAFAAPNLLIIKYLL